ncbi:hypothetical protein ULO1_24040 [Carboxydocella sp. ULO1]|nr:hypothetical protein ULO1_24040 [Carboxydocella sp. ULO1]
MKLAGTVLLSATIRRFEPTYEELKPCCALISTMKKYGFEPTYEELKPFSIVDYQ